MLGLVFWVLFIIGAAFGAWVSYPQPSPGRYWWVLPYILIGILGYVAIGTHLAR